MSPAVNVFPLCLCAQTPGASGASIITTSPLVPEVLLSVARVACRNASPPPLRLSLVALSFYCSSLELFFASSQSNKLLYGEPPTSPRASRKFSSPPPLSITKTSSPNRRRKLSLNIPIITGGKALDLAALSCSPNGYASMHSTMSPFGKNTLDINKLYVSSTMAAKISDDGEAKAEGKVEESVPNKQGQNFVC